MKLYGKSFNRKQLESSIGRIGQIAGSRHYRLIEGKSDGVRAIDVNTGGGLLYTVLPDRAMDISLCSYKGVNLVYQGETGETHPSYYTGIGNDWMNGFFAGLLTTCGLQNLSGPCMDEGIHYGLHGGISYTPAARFNDMSRWEGDEYILEFEGIMEESVFFGTKLILKRNIKSIAGDKKLLITDSVENIGSKKVPFVILYHINAGFPLLDQNSKFVLSTKNVWPYDKKSEQNIDKYSSFEIPVEDFPEENFLHKMAADKEGMCYAAVINPSIESGLGLYVCANVDSLPYISQWKSAANREYVMAMEPVNTKVANRLELRKEGILPVIKPGEIKKMKVEIGVLAGGDEIDAFEKKVSQIVEGVK